MIRESQFEDLEIIMDIWLSSNLEVHSFVPSKFWKSNFDDVKEAISEGVIVYEEDGEIRGFIGVQDGYVAGLFVKKAYRRLGIGKKLLDYAKSHNDRLELDVFVANDSAVKFYCREGFKVTENKTSDPVNCEEYHMEWSERLKL